MELMDLIRFARKWLWLFAVAALAGGGLVYLYADSLPVRYRSQAVISVGGYLDAPNPNTQEIRTGFELVQTYRELTSTRTVLQGVIDAGYPFTLEELEEGVDAVVVGGTSMVAVSLTLPDRDLVRGATDELVNQLLLSSPGTLSPDDELQLERANTEIERMQRLQNQLEARLNEANAALDDVTMGVTEVTQTELLELTARRDVLIDQLNETALAIVSYSGIIAETQARVNSLTIIDEAHDPYSVRADVMNSSIIGAIAGLALALGIVWLVEYLDNTIKSGEDAIRMTGLEVLSKVRSFGRRGPRHGFRRVEPLVTEAAPQSGVSESYRALRTRLLYSVNPDKTRIYLVTSTAPGEGKSVTAANLAISMAQANLRVLLIDADLRRSRQHEFFELSNQQGLTDLLLKEPVDRLDQPVEVNLGAEALPAVQPTHVENLRLITSGAPCPNPAEVLGSGTMRRWVDALRQAVDVDVIIFDTPSVNMAADSTVLAAMTGGGVVLVMRAGKTRRMAAYEAATRLRQLNLNVLGTVLNSVRATDRSLFARGTEPISASTGPGGFETIMRRDMVPGLDAALQQATAESSSGGHLLHRIASAAELPNVVAGAGGPSEIKRNTLVFFIEGFEKPVTVNVRHRITLGRYTTGIGAAEHIDLEPYGAFETGVSRIHVAIERRRDSFYLEDLDSSNGTWINGEAAKPGQEYKLENGYLLQIASLYMRVYYLTESDRAIDTLEIPAVEFD
jgi:capsular exopolysaccharide synthesis family protein